MFAATVLAPQPYTVAHKRWAALSHRRSSAARAANAQAPADATSPKLEAVTVEGQRQLERRVSHFVSSVIVHYFSDSLVRWATQICPLVAGLPREQGEYILARVSQLARDASAPLAGEHCRANFYVIATSEPEVLLQRWWRRNPGMYNTANGVAGINHFIHSAAAIRCWYNSESARATDLRSRKTTSWPVCSTAA